MHTVQRLLGIIRAPFLVLAPVCVVLGVGAAARSGQHLYPWHVALVCIGAVTAHISVNALNEYVDFTTGLDAKTQKTPFSGGSGVLPSHPSLARAALGIGLSALTITAGIGLYFTMLRGLALLPLGLLGLAIIMAYTPWLTRYPACCLFAPGIGFGPLMVMGTQFALTGQYTWTAFMVSLIPLFLVSNLLLLNQFPDVESDKGVGRRHYPIVIGRHRSSIIYSVFLALTYLVIIIGVLLTYLPITSLLGLATIVIALPASVTAYRHSDSLNKLMPALGMNVILNILTPSLVAIGLFIGR